MRDRPDVVRRALVRTAPSRQIILSAIRGYELPGPEQRAKLLGAEPEMRRLVLRELNFLEHVASTWPFPLSHWAADITDDWTPEMAVDVVLERYRATDTLPDFEAWLIRHTDYWPNGGLA